jgi:hypothetical protein
MKLGTNFKANHKAILQQKDQLSQLFFFLAQGFALYWLAPMAPHPRFSLCPRPPLASPWMPLMPHARPSDPRCPCPLPAARSFACGPGGSSATPSAAEIRDATLHSIPLAFGLDLLDQHACASGGVPPSTRALVLKKEVCPCPCSSPAPSESIRNSSLDPVGAFGPGPTLGLDRRPAGPGGNLAQSVCYTRDRSWIRHTV